MNTRFTNGDFNLDWFYLKSHDSVRIAQVNEGLDGLAFSSPCSSRFKHHHGKFHFGEYCFFVTAKLLNSYDLNRLVLVVIYTGRCLFGRRLYWYSHLDWKSSILEVVYIGSHLHLKSSIWTRLYCWNQLFQQERN